MRCAAAVEMDTDVVQAIRGGAVFVYTITLAVRDTRVNRVRRGEARPGPWAVPDQDDILRSLQRLCRLGETRLDGGRWATCSEAM